MWMFDFRNNHLIEDDSVLKPDEPFSKFKSYDFLNKMSDK